MSAPRLIAETERLWACGTPSQLAQLEASKWAFISIWLFTIVIYARPEDIFPQLGVLHLTFISGLCAGASYLLAIGSGKAPIAWTSELSIMLMLTAWYLAGVPFSIWPSGTLHMIVPTWLKTVFVFFLLTQTLLTLSRIRTILWAIVLSELAVTAISIARPSSAIWVGDRLLGVNQGILGWNFLGVAAALTIPYIAALFIAHRGFIGRALLAATFASMIWMLMLTASRGGILSVLVSALLTWVLVLRGSVQGRVVGIGIIVGLAVSVSLAPAVFWQRLGTVWEDGQSARTEASASAEESKENHLFALNESIQCTLDHPLFGVGMGNFDVAIGLKLGRWMGSHNTFTQVSSEAGIPALVLFLSLPVVALRGLFSIKKRALHNSRDLELNLMANASIASILGFAFGGFFAHIAYEYYIFYPLVIAIALRRLAVAEDSRTSFEQSSLNFTTVPA